MKGRGVGLCFGGDVAAADLRYDDQAVADDGHQNMIGNPRHVRWSYPPFYAWATFYVEMVRRAISTRRNGRHTIYERVEHDGFRGCLQPLHGKPAPGARPKGGAFDAIRGDAEAVPSG